MKKLKKTLAICLSIVLVTLSAGCTPKVVDTVAPVESPAVSEAAPVASEVTTSGVFVGESQGKNGPIKLEVTIEDAAITKITVVESSESDFTKAIFEELPTNIIAANSADVDAISGATMTSDAITTAVKDAITKSGITLVAKEVASSAVKAEDITTDIVIIGSGGAGLSAAIEATMDGSKVIVVEKNSFMGGNTNYATAGMNAAGTKHQTEQNIVDTPQLFYDDTMKAGKNLNDPALLKELTEKSSETIDWLESLGADLSKITRTGGQSADRTHTTDGGAAIGAHLMTVFDENVKKLGIEVRLNTKAIEIMSEGNKATGIKVENADGAQYVISAKAVIVASGGFGANQDMVVSYKPELKGFGTTNQPGATGDAFPMVEKLDVALVDMDQIQTHPTVVPKINEMITEAVRGEGAILLNRDGKRFINELETRDVVSKAILEQEGATAFLVFDEGVFGRLAAIKKYKSAGLLTEATTIKELAEKLGLNTEESEKTVIAYNEFVKANNDADFGKTSLPGELSTAPFYAVEVSPAIHHTMGGIKINTNTEVLNNSGSIVEGLFAAGEVTGGVHGGNRVGGNAVADITVFGRIAGKNANAYVTK